MTLNINRNVCVSIFGKMRAPKKDPPMTPIITETQWADEYNHAKINAGADSGSNANHKITGRRRDFIRQTQCLIHRQHFQRA